MAAHISISKQLNYAQQGEMGGTDIREPSTAIFAVSSIDRYIIPNNQTSAGQLSAGGKALTNQSVLPLPNDGFSLGVVNPLYPLGIANPGKMFPGGEPPALSHHGLHPLEKAGTISRM